MSYAFPNIAVPEKDKQKKEYYEQWAQAVCYSSFGGNWSMRFNKMKLLYDFFLYGTGNDIAGHLTSAPDGSAMPGIWTSQNTVKTRIRTLIGEMEERSYIIKVRATNIEAQARKFEERERLRVKRLLGPLIEAVEEETGVMLESPEYVPQNDQELQEYMDLRWKDKHILILEGALKWLRKRNEDDESRKRELLDQFICNHSISRVEIVDGLPRIRAIDPLTFGYDGNTKDDILSDASYFYEFQYEPLATVAQRYQLELKELQDAATTYGDGMNVRNVAALSYGGCMPDQVNRWYRTDDGMLKALVIKIVWRDFKTLAHKSETKEEYSAEFFQDVTDVEPRERDKDKIKYNKIEVWRQATLIGGQFLAEWGECRNQARELSSLHRSQCPYIVWKNEHFQGAVSSMVEQLLGLQTLKDIALYQLQIQLARAVGKVLVFDEAMMADNETKETVLRRIKADGIAFINSKEYQLNSANNLFKDFDIGLSQSIPALVNIVAYYEEQMSMMSGMTAERMGEISGPSQSTGTTNASIVQGKLVTTTFFKGFERHWSRCLNAEAKLVKICMAGKEKFAPIIGDVGVDFLRDNYDIDLDEFDVWAESQMPDHELRAIMIGMIQQAQQTGELSFLDAIEIIREPDLDIAIRMYQRKTRLRQRQMAQQEAQMQEAQMQQIQEDRAFQAGEAQKDRDTEMFIEGNKTQGGLKKQLIGSRTKLQQERLKLFDRY